MTRTDTQPDITALAALRELARGRRSWLGYTGEPVDHDAIRDLVEIATTAPSETNLQPWRFVVATGDAIETVLPAFIAPNRPKLRDAGNVIVVLADPTTIETNEKARLFYSLEYTTPRDFAQRNASLAAMVLMLAAHAAGLATRPMVGFDPDALKQALDVPGHWTPVVALLIGHPDEPTMPDTGRRDVEECLTFLA